MNSVLTCGNQISRLNNGTIYEREGTLCEVIFTSSELRQALKLNIFTEYQKLRIWITM